MDLQILRNKLDEISKINSDTWISSLDNRKKKELEFHDKDRDEDYIKNLSKTDLKKYRGNRKFYAVTNASNTYVKEWIKINATGKIFLDYACGNGSSAIIAAKAGAKLAIGIDISPVSISNAKRSAEREGISSNTYFLLADAENTKLPENSIDVVICSGMLHHLDLSYAFPELRRIMSKDGRLLAVEALNYNPIIKLYRKMTPDMRTEWEKNHIISRKEVKFASYFFDVKNVKFWHITSIFAAFIKSLLPLFNFLDLFLTRIPGIRLMAWQFTFELVIKRIYAGRPK